MFTVCSKCNLRLTVTATDLRAAQGYVRCGRCHNVFNALAALADDPARVTEQAGLADTQSRATLTPPPPEPKAATPDTATHDTSLEFNPASTNINEVFIEAAASERTGTFESIILSGEESGAESGDAEAFEEELVAPQALAAPPMPAPPPPSPPMPAPVPVPVTATVPAEHGVNAIPVAALPRATPPPTDEEISFMAEWSAATPRTAQPPGVNAAAAIEIAEALKAADGTDATASADEPAAAALETVLLEPARASARVPRWVLGGAAGLLALVLLAQVVNHYRGELADSSALQRPLAAIYQRLGQPLEPRWDIASYEVRQLGASTEGAAPGDLVVRASISNRAKRVQPLPLLRVVMQDRFGNRVAARDLQPGEYLGRGAPPVSLMAPGQRVDVQVAFQDPGQAATGFEIDACMAHGDHTVSCANDPSSR